MIPQAPTTWKPQTFGRKPARAIADPIIEPAWEGIRVLAYIEAGRPVRLIDEAGVDRAADHPEIASELASAALADVLVLDGWLSDQATRTGVGAGPEGPEVPTVTASMTQMLVGTRRRRTLPGEVEEDRTPPPPHDRDNLVAFVATDLLLLDGQELLDIPLLERRRVLEGVLLESDLVRRSAFIRPPIGAWLMTLRSVGFRRFTAKGANSRYRPGEASDDWAEEALPRR